MLEARKAQESTEPQCRETLEEFSKRVGLKYVRSKGGGVQLGAHPGGNLLPKKPKQPESIEEFCDRLGIKRNNRKGGQQFGAYPGGNLLPKKPKQNSNG